MNWSVISTSYILQTRGSHNLIQVEHLELVNRHADRILNVLLGLFARWCLTPLSTIFKLWSVLLVEGAEDQEKTTDLSQVPGKCYHIMLYTSPWSTFELTTSVVIGTDCIGSCKSSYHATTATTALFYYASMH